MSSLPFEQWPRFVYLLDEARSVAKPDRLGNVRGFYCTWASTKLRWNNRPAGLVRFPNLQDEILTATARRFSEILQFQITPVDLLPSTDIIIDNFGTCSLIVHGDL